MVSRHILITAALPYANGPIHIGHLVEYIQADIWARYQKSCGHDCLYICASDAHGTPVMLRAQAEGVSPQALVERYHAEHERDFAAFDVGFDNFYTTDSPENRAQAERIFQRAQTGGYVEKRTIRQAYCETQRMFLPDRYIRGQCPKCGAQDQYGDSCEACGAVYTPAEMVAPRCALDNLPITFRPSEHYFFKLSAFTDMLRGWATAEHLHPQVVAKLQEWFTQGLLDWDISRDAPYAGFTIPGETGKYFYVWWDAPIGYIASTQNWCERHGRPYESYWIGEDAELYHFIGKDILYFHTLFWPAMLSCAGYRMPRRVFIHGFLTVDGLKMSKSRGTFINAATYLRYLDPQYLRYYYACKLGPDTSDLGLSTQDFAARVNADLVGNFANLPSRSAGLLARRLDNRLGRMDAAGRELVDRVQASAAEIGLAYEACEYGQAVRLITAQADALNRYMEGEKPWERVKTEPERARTALTTALNGIRLLSAYLGPVLPRFPEKMGRLLGCPTPDFTRLADRVEDRAIGAYERIAERLDPKGVEAMIAETAAEQAAQPEKA